MRPFFSVATALVWYLVLLSGMTSALPYSRYGANKGLKVLSYAPSAGSTSLILPCADCHVSGTRITELIFDFTVQPASTPDWIAFTLNNETLDLGFVAEDIVRTSRLLPVSNAGHKISKANVSVTAGRLTSESTSLAKTTHRIWFEVMSYNTVQLGEPRPSFSIDVDPMSPVMIGHIGNEPYGTGAGAGAISALSLDDIPEVDEVTEGLAADAATLLLLEAQAEDIRAQIAAKKQAIAAHLRGHRDSLPLKHLLDECDSLLCTARVIAQRICDKMGVDTEPSIGYAKISSGSNQQTISSDGMSEKITTPQQQRANLKLILSKDKSKDEYNFVDLINPTNPLIHALEIVCSILGLTALYSLIRSRCVSARTKVEWAAAREERRTARAYRRAARRAEMRKRWDAFVDAINCFGKKEQPRTEDYEEKRALILQDAFLEQLDDVDSAEKGQTMEAEIRELRNAHNIVAGLVNVDEYRQGLTHHMHDPPPPLVPIPRSRASTQTLPPYISDAESLPSYRSRPLTLLGSNSSVMTTSPSVSDDEEFIVSHSSHTRYTPGSSVIDTSPRISADTLRTRLSKGTQT